jgi:SAM-dependent methyltransferase
MPEVPNWWLDQKAHAGHEHLDAAYAAGYDRKSPTDWSDRVALLRERGIGPTSTVVDLGAGTGTFALALAPHVARVVGVDVSEAMVQTMRARGVEAVRAGFLDYEHEGAPPDAVFTRNALHHLPDFWKVIALYRIAGLLRPEGVLLLEDLVYSFDPRETNRALAEWLAGASTDPADGWTAQQLAEHVREEHSTFDWLLEPMLERAGFEIGVRHLSESGAYAAYACVLRAAHETS